ncbi:MAG: NAAT family transporter [Flavobacteriales bacterium]|nr:NAAT family transporter [Flavobacteriales bacterium]
MNELYTFGLIVFTSFFTLINPLGVMPIFMTMTSDLSESDRRKTALKASIVSFFTLAMFAFTGQILFNFFGISVNALRIVGGIIFFMMGQDMLQARLTRIKLDSQKEVDEYVGDISITPLAIPMITGPGAITNAIVMMEDATTIELKSILMLGLGIVMILTFLILLSSGRIMKVLGDTGNKIMMRIMGLIVMIIAVEFFLSGFKPIFIDLMKEVLK